MAQPAEQSLRYFLIGAGALVATSLLLTGFVRLTDIGAQQEPDAVVIESRLLQFKDDADGGVSVYDFESGARIWVFEPETGGFVRTAMRALVHSRKLSGHGQEEPFELARTARGRLIMTDPTTQKKLALESFGGANENDFAQLLDHEDGDV